MISLAMTSYSTSFVSPWETGEEPQRKVKGDRADLSTEENGNTGKFILASGNVGRNLWVKYN